MADEAATAHKLKFFEGGATPNLAVSVDLPDPDDFFEFVKRYREEGEGVANAYKTLFFNTGTTFQTVGTDLRQLDFKVTQGAGETRIASAAGVPPVIVGFSEGLEAATYSNYALAMRRFADLDAAAVADGRRLPPKHPRGAAGAERGTTTATSALKDDIVNRAEVQNKQANAAKMFADGGWEPDSIIDALDADDLSRLVHSGCRPSRCRPPPRACRRRTATSPHWSGRSRPVRPKRTPNCAGDRRSQCQVRSVTAAPSSSTAKTRKAAAASSRAAWFRTANGQRSAPPSRGTSWNASCRRPHQNPFRTRQQAEGAV